MLEVNGLRKRYGDGEESTLAIDRLDFGVSEGEFVCVIGPSGCGKTTLLRCFSGLLEPTEGTVTLNGKRVTEPPKEMALVFQEYSRSLFPWMTVSGNVRLPLLKTHNRGEANDLVAQALGSVGLDGFGDRYPWQLSGGMQQRVAIARAIAYQPDVLLMDEPFASVDAQTRTDLEDLLLDIWRDSDLTVLFVTHDIDEAIYLGDRIVVLNGRPTSVREVLDVDLPRPRDQITTKGQPRFGELRELAYRLLRPDATEVA